MSAEDRDSTFYYVVDKETGERIHYCLWADDVSGGYEVAYPGYDTAKMTGKIQIIDSRNEKDVLVK